jgi:PncC family amidohydrolase
MREKLGEYCYGEGAVSMESVVGRALRERGWKIGLAESCTGGLVAHRITAIPGSSAYFLGGVQAYANSAKMALLGVRRETLQAQGAVSEETAGEMAAGARAVRRDIAVSTPASPVPTAARPRSRSGLASSATAEGVVTRTQLWGTRDWVKLLASRWRSTWCAARRSAAVGTRRLPAPVGFARWSPSTARRRARRRRRRTKSVRAAAPTSPGGREQAASAPSSGRGARRRGGTRA